MEQATQPTAEPSGPSKPWSEPPEAALEELGTEGEAGLSAEEARQRLERYGPNRLRSIEHRSVWQILVDQVKSLVVLLLFGAAAASMAFQEWTDAAAIGVVVLVNTLIGFFTELRARRSMEALQELGDVEADVLRDGEEQRISSEEVVPGDVLLLDEGDLIAADIRILEADNLQVDESSLTGESVPVDKHAEPVDEGAVLADRTSMAYKGTAVTKGSGRGVVVATGMDTSIGEVSSMVEEAEGDESPLEKRLDELARRLVWLTLLLAAVVAGVGLLAQRDWLMMLETAIALAVAAIPEGLPIVATIALARGMRRMLRRNALIRKLASVQTLGATNVICSDKTGTLTRNRMAVRWLELPGRALDLSEESLELEEGDDEALERAIRVAVLCNTATPAEDGKEENDEGDPMEIALLDFGRDVGRGRDSLLESLPEEDVEPFDRETKMMATFHGGEEGGFVAVKGAPEAVLDACSHVLGAEGEEALEEGGREKWREKNEELAGRGLRILGLAYREGASPESPYEDLRFLGFVGLVDPPRDAVPQAVRDCRDAGIRVVMVTGDQPATAASIARQVSIVDEDEEANVVHGADFEAHRDELAEVPVFARVDPRQKLDLIDHYRDAGVIVAMTGDGVNDAPALKRADIGIAMGERGTEVAREAADMVLLDDAFETIVAAIREGRVIFDNVRRFVVYLLSGNVGEILAVGLAALTSAPLPLLPLQILYLNMLNDVFPALALGVGEGGHDVMKRPPRGSGEAILTRFHWGEIAGYGVVIGATVLGVFALALGPFGMSQTQAVTVSFLTLSVGRLWHAFNMRTPQSGFLDNDVVKNPWLWGAIALCLGLLALAVFLPPLADVLELGVPPAEGWLLIGAGSLVPLVLGQIYVAIRGARQRS